jgi:hypothetical protein
MSRITCALIVLAIMFPLVSISEAGGYSSPCNQNPIPDIHPMCWAGFCPDMKSYCEMERRDMDRNRDYLYPCDKNPIPDIHPMCWAGFCPDMKSYCEMERRYG